MCSQHLKTDSLLDHLSLYFIMYENITSMLAHLLDEIERGAQMGCSYCCLIDVCLIQQGLYILH